MSVFLVQKGMEVAGVYLEPGDTIETIPDDAVAWLLECGAIVETEAKPKPAAKKGGK